MMRESVKRFSEKIMLQQDSNAMTLILMSSRFGLARSPRYLPGRVGGSPSLRDA